MISRCFPHQKIFRRSSGERGSMLITALLFAAGIALVLGGYLALSRTTLKTAHRTFFANDASNLAEAGLEEALYCFNQMSAGNSAATAWTGWTISSTNAMRTLSPFNRDQNAIGVVKVYVKGYDGTDASPYVVSQAVITPFDGSAPIVRTVQLLISRTTSNPLHGLVGLNGLTLAGGAFADGFNSNPLASPIGPWLPYTTLLANSGASVVVLAGTADIAAGQIRGDLYLGAGVSSPSASNVTGTITPNYSAIFPFPTYPTSLSVSRSYNLGSSIPALLPRVLDLPASDGRYYYFCNNTTVTGFAVTALCDVSIIGTNTGMAGGIVLPVTSTLRVYMDRALTLPAGTSNLNILGGAIGLRIYTTTSSPCVIADNNQLVAWFQAPNAALQATGTSPLNVMAGFYLANTIYASGTMNFHYDESLPSAGTATAYTVTRWLDLQQAPDRAAVPGLTGNYLQ